MNAFYITAWFLICLIGQVLLFSNLAVWGGVVIFYLYLLVKMPVELNRPLQIFLGFLLGLMIDLFCNTPGMNALAAVTTMWVRIPILHLYVVADDFKAGSPNRSTIGESMYLRFSISIVVVHTIMLYIIESFTCFNFFHMLVKIIISIILTSLFLYAVEEFEYRRRQDA